MHPRQLIAIPFVLLVAGNAAAQPQPSAEELFREGNQLFQRGETKSACERFAASYKIDLAPGTLFNLAACHEKEGRLSQARTEFRDFIDRANKAGKADKAQPAVDRVAAIEARMPKLKFAFSPEPNVQSILVDGAPLDAAEWHKPLLVDAGSHTIEFRAPDKPAATKTVTTGGDGSTATIDVPVLAPPQVASPAVAEGGPHQGEAPAREPSNRSAKRTIAIVVGGAGIVALGIGTYFGIHTLSQKSDADKLCGAPSGTTACPTDAQTRGAQNELDSARTSSWVSTLGLGVGVVAVGVGAYLFLTGGAHAGGTTAASAVRVVPTLGPNAGGLSLSGAF
jgi:hypothetical protein